MTVCVCGGGAEWRACGQRVKWRDSEGVGLGLGPVPADALWSYSCKWYVYMFVCLYIVFVVVNDYLYMNIWVNEWMLVCIEWLSDCDTVWLDPIRHGGNKLFACFNTDAAIRNHRWDVWLYKLLDSSMRIWSWLSCKKWLFDTVILADKSVYPML